MVMDSEAFQLLQVVGILLVILGVLLFVAPFFLERLPSLEKIPWIILYIYRKDGFVFVTSPILIVITIISILLRIIVRS